MLIRARPTGQLGRRLLPAVGAGLAVAVGLAVAAAATDLPTLVDPSDLIGPRLHATLPWLDWMAAGLPLALAGSGLWLLVLRRAVARRTAVLDRAVREAQESDARFRAFSEFSPLPIIVSRLADGTVLLVNRAFCDMVGKPAAELIGAPAQWMWEDLSQRQRMIEALRRGEPVRGLEIRARTASGELRDGLVYATPIAFAGEPALLASTVNITEQKRAFAERSRADARLAGILEITPDAVLTVDALRRVTLFNRGAEHHFGYRAQEMLGKDIARLLPERERGELLARIAAFIASSRPDGMIHRLGECTCRRRDGSEFPAKASIARIAVEGELTIIVMLRDSTERKAAEAALILAKEAAEAANVAKSQFLANMSHELRTPLNAILGFSEIMLRESYGPLGDRRYLEYAGDILNSGTHLLNLINDILDLAKVEAGRVELAEEEHAIGDLVHGALTLVREQARRYQVALNTKLPDSMPVVRCDGRKLKQVILNLLSNAVKFSLPGGAVTTQAWSGPDGAVIQVIDTGIGMRIEDVPRAFALFGQVDGGLDRKHTGTGLGLLLSKALVELHGGTLDLQSAPGAGTTATVRLPASRVIARRAAPVAANARPRLGPS